MENISKNIINFISNNWAILMTIGIAVVSSIFNIYQYFENKKLKKYSTEKDLKRRQASLEKLRNDHASNNWLLQKLGEKEKEKNEFKYREKCLLAEIEYLQKILKINKS